MRRNYGYYCDVNTCYLLNVCTRDRYLGDLKSRGIYLKMWMNTVSYSLEILISKSIIEGDQEQGKALKIND